MAHLTHGGPRCLEQYEFSLLCKALARREVPLRIMWPLRFVMPQEAPGALGSEVPPGSFEVELKHLHTYEWTCTVEDVPSRRTQRELHLNAAERAAVACWCAARWPSARADAGALSTEEKAWS